MKRSHDRKVKAPREVLPTVCFCGRRIAGHPRCSACAVAVGQGHEPVVPEPYGEHRPVCSGCFMQLKLLHLWIRRPADAGHQVVLTSGGLIAEGLPWECLHEAAALEAQ